MFVEGILHCVSSICNETHIVWLNEHKQFSLDVTKRKQSSTAAAAVYNLP